MTMSIAEKYVRMQPSSATILKISEILKIAEILKVLQHQEELHSCPIHAKLFKTHLYASMVYNNTQ